MFGAFSHQAINWGYLCLLAFGIAICALIISINVVRYGLSAIALRPIVLFSLFFSVIHFAVPALKHVQHQYRYQLQYQSETLLLNALTCIGAIVLAAILCQTRQYSPVGRAVVSRVYAMDGKRASRIALALYFVGLIFATRDAYVILFKISYLEFMRDLHAASEIRGSWHRLSNLCILGSALYMVSCLVRNRFGAFRIVLLLSMLVQVTLYAFLLNSRNTFLLLVILNLASYLAFKPVFPKRRSDRLIVSRSTVRTAGIVLVTGVLLVCVAQMITAIRYGNFDNAYMRDRREHATFYMLDGAFGNDENLLWLEEAGQTEFQLGWTYVAGVVNLIPRSVWPDKPVGGGPILTNMIRPGTYVEGAQGNNSFTTGLLPEAFMNFGFLGVVIAIFGWAFFASRAIRAFQRSSNLFFRVAFLAVGMSLSSALLYSEFLGFFGRLFLLVVPVFLMGIITKIRFNRGMSA